MRTQQKKETLNKILPEPIADIILSFNRCSNCERLMKLEDDYYFEEHPITCKLSTFEKQRFMLNDRNNFDVYFAGDNVETKSKKLVNVFKNSNNPYKKVFTSFIKNRRVRFFQKFDEVVEFFHNKKTMYHVTTQENILRLNYSYYKKHILIKCYLKALCMSFLFIL